MFRSSAIAVAVILSTFVDSQRPTIAFAAEANSGNQCGVTKQNWAARAEKRSTQVQRGLPVLRHPADNPPTAQKIALGRKLFFDRRLSINGTMSCAMCHVPEQGFANHELRTSVGVEGRSVKRNAPTVINIGFLDVLFHDGREHSLETQVIGPLLARNEMANPSIGIVVRKLSALPDYIGLFEAAFGKPVSVDRLGMALASYQRSLSVAASPFDRWYYGKQTDALSDLAKRGFELFAGEAGCASCHEIGEEWALFTDQQFHDTGYGWMREKLRQYPPKTIRVQVAPGIYHDVDYSQIEAVGLKPQADIGRYAVTEDPEDRWKFRTPPLRNVAATPPYMHDGALATLREVVEFYDSGGPDHSLKDSRIRPLDLNDYDVDALVAFLQSLTSDGIECLTAEARILPPDNQ